MVRKKMILVASGLISLVLVIWNDLGNYRICDFLFTSGSEGNCPYLLTSAALNMLPILPLFLLSLITYKMRDDVYQSWFRLARWWIPLSMLLIFLAPEYGGNWMYSLEKGSVAFFFSLIFLVISIILIIYKHFSPLGSPTSK